MKMVFKNKVQKYGYYFGMILRDGSVTVMLFSIMMMCNRDGVDWKAMLFFLFMFALHVYGCWRTGYDVKEEYEENEDN